MTLLSAGLQTLRQANEALSKRRMAKKTRIRQGEALTVKNANHILAQEEVDEQIWRDKRSGGVITNEGKWGARYCGIRGKSGHNSRTCQKVIIVEEQSDSE